MFQKLVLVSPQLPGPPDLGIQMEHRVEIADRKNLQQVKRGYSQGASVDSGREDLPSSLCKHASYGL